MNLDLTEEDYEKINNLFISEKFASPNNVLVDSLCGNLENMNISSSPCVENYEGFLIGVKIIRRPDGNVLIFIISRTSYEKIMNDLENLIPFYTTVIRRGLYVWRFPYEQLRSFFQKITEIDGSIRLTRR